jgi:N-acetylmuramoyl-L-alanine amidase
MSKFQAIIVLFSGAFIICVLHFLPNSFSYIIDKVKNVSAVFFTEATSSKDLIDKYNSGKSNEKLKILIVAGHDDYTTGATFGGLRESDINLELAGKLADFLATDENLDVIIYRDKNGINQEFENFYQSNKESVKKFVAGQKKEMEQLIEKGLLAKTDGVPHGFAPEDSAIKLYSINKWASEKGIGIIIHIHFNDYPRRKQYLEGKYTGFSIYVPEKQYSNAKASREIAETVFNRLERFFPKSDLSKENAGVVEDQELIALGSANTADSAAILIEYGYIYESQFENEKVRHTLFKEMAFQTYMGLEDFLKESKASGKETTLLDSPLILPLKKGDERNISVLKVQTALLLLGIYPPVGKEKTECPLTGKFGGCTELAVSNFKKKYGIFGEEGAGKKTIGKIEELYNSN